MFPGELKSRPTVQCAKCYWIHDTSNSKTEFIKELKANGWKKLQNIGWVCSRCLRKIKDG